MLGTTMPPRNPSELCRLETELSELRQDLKNDYPKAHKEGLLRQIREIEGILGLESRPYNSSEF